MIWLVVIDDLIVVELKVTAIERGECAGEDRAAGTGLEPRVVLRVREELGQLREIDDAIGSLGVGVDSPARLAGDLAEIDLPAGLGVDVEGGVSRRADQRGQAREVEHAARAAGLDGGAVGLGELSQGRESQVAAAVDVKVRRGDRSDLAGGDRRLIVVELKIAAIESGECPGEDRAAVTGLEPRVILRVREELRAASRDR